jgi:hypothetical protein
MAEAIAVKRLLDALAECCESLAAELDARHEHRERYPTIMREYTRDMAPVDAARELLRQHGIARGELPMATAPQDGTPILAWTAEGSPWIVSWEGSGGWRIKQRPGRDPVLYIDAVRWMPLPP